MSFLQKIFGSSNQRALKKMQVHVDQINFLEAEYQNMEDDELFALKDKLAKNYADDLSNLIPHAFAATREASVRTLGLRHFDSQMLGGIALADGNIAEMKTGEGKTLVATLPAYLNAIQGNKVVLVTVNDYLAQRDAEWMPSVELGWIVVEDGNEKSVYYIDAEGQCWDEISNKLLDKEGVLAARFDEIQLIRNHKV